MGDFVLREDVRDLTVEYLSKFSDEELDAIKEYCDEMKANKKNDEQSKKVEINSEYGAAGAASFAFYDIRISASTTAYGRTAIRTIGHTIDNIIISECGEYIKNYNVSEKKPKGSALIYSHTDSVYFELQPYADMYKAQGFSKEEIQEKLLAKGNEFNDIINEVIFPRVLKAFNARSNEMQMNFEIFADKGIFLQKARYYMRLVMKDAKILAEPKFKIIGMELKKASAPNVTKKLVNDKPGGQLDKFLDDDTEKIRGFLKKAKDKFYSAPIKDLVRTVNVKKIVEFEIDDAQLKAIKERILAFSRERRSLIRDPSDKSKYQTRISMILKKIGSGGESYSDFRAEVEKWYLRIADDRGNYDSYDASTSKMLMGLYGFDTRVTSQKSVDGKDRSMSEIEFRRAFKKLFDGEVKGGFRPSIEFFPNPDSFLIKGLSFNSKMAAIHNKFLELNKEKYPTLEPIRDGDRTYWCALKRPNPFFNSERIAFKSDELLPLIEEYIDKDAQFKNGFEGTVKEVVNALGVNFYYNPCVKFV